jgi:hypothetical protein
VGQILQFPLLQIPQLAGGAGGGFGPNFLALVFWRLPLRVVPGPLAQPIIVPAGVFNYLPVAFKNNGAGNAIV